MSSRRHWDRTSASDLIVSAMLVYLLMLMASLSQASTEDGLPAVGTGTFLVTGEQAHDVLLGVESSFDLAVTGMVVQATVKQGFVNTSDQWIEGRYVFPLPPDSAVNGLTIRVGERVIRGVVKEAEEARALFIQARNQHRVASMVEQQRPNLFTNHVTNIAPGERIDVTLSYLQTLSYDGRAFSLRVPMTITPRYRPSHTPLGNADLPVVPFREGLPTTAAVVVTLASGLALSAIEAPYHTVSTVQETGAYIVRPVQDRVVMDRDFVLRWSPDIGTAPNAAFFTESMRVPDPVASVESVSAHHGMLMMMPPDTFQTDPLPRELILVIDTSGSMAGESITQAKQALLVALRRLTVNDSFNIIEFNASTHPLFESSVAATPENIRTATRFVKGLQANGGTEMFGALRAALLPTVDAAAPTVRQVVFITDGSVTNEASLLGLIANAIGESRLFTVGIGAAPNSYFMEKAAQHGRGVFTYIGDTLEVQDVMTALFETIEKPMLTNIQVEFHNSGETIFYPQHIPDLYANEPLVLFVKMAERTDTITVRGELAGQYWEQDIVPHWEASHPGMGALWAREKIQTLMDEAVRQGNRDYYKEDIVNVALTYQLVSRYTRFIAVDTETQARGAEDLRKLAVANNRPAGSQHQGPSVGYPKTALGINQLLFVGTLSLFLAILALCLKQDRRIVRIKCAPNTGEAR